MPLDLTAGSSSGGVSNVGLRWELPIHLFDALFFLQQGRMTVPLQASRQAELLLVHIRMTIQQGLSERHLQRIPHLILLSKSWYHGQLKPLLAKWLVMYLSLRRPSGLTDDQMLTYLMLPKVRTRLSVCWSSRSSANKRIRMLTPHVCFSFLL